MRPDCLGGSGVASLGLARDTAALNSKVAMVFEKRNCFRRRLQNYAGFFVGLLLSL